MAYFGLVPEGPVVASVPAFYLWPENAEGWAVFMACGALWRSGMGGRDGFDYPGAEIVIRDVCRIPFRRRSKRMREIHLMANAALEEWAKARQKAQ